MSSVSPDSVSPGSAPPGSPHRAPLLILAAAAFLVLWPGPLAEGALGHPVSDLADHYWGTWWFGGSSSGGAGPTPPP